MRPMDFFDWRGAGGFHSVVMDDERNAAKRKKTRPHGMEWLGIGISHFAQIHAEAVRLWLLDGYGSKRLLHLLGLPV